MTVSAWQRYLKAKRFQYSSIVMSCDRESKGYTLFFNRELKPVLIITDYSNKNEERLQGHKAINRLIKEGIKPSDMTAVHNEREVERLL